MHKTRFWIIVGCCLFAVVAAAWAQFALKAGLWEMTTTMNLQQSPFPTSMTQNPNSPYGNAPRTIQVCLTQELIDKFGGPMPPSTGECPITNLVRKPGSTTAEMVCNGRMTGPQALSHRFLTVFTPRARCTSREPSRSEPIPPPSNSPSMPLRSTREPIVAASAPYPCRNKRTLPLDCALQLSAGGEDVAAARLA